MRLEDLRAFIRVAESGSISQAALGLGLTQPSVSRLLAALEEECGTRLFHRTGRGVQLTEAGQAALPKARAIVLDADRLVVDMRDFGQSPSGVVTVALLPWMMQRIAGDLYDEVRRAYPRIVLRMAEGLSSRNEEGLADGRIDIALIGRYRATPARGEEVLIDSQLALISPRRPEAVPKTIAFRDLASIPLVLPSTQHRLRAAVEAVARSRRVHLNVVAEADSYEAQKAIVRRQGCCMLLSPETAQHDVAGGQFHAREIIQPRMPRLVVMSTTTHRPLSRAARGVAAIVRRLVRKAAAR
ncbi:MAG: LysR family transcriptional regulator [Rubrivivax sp.]|nr:LysR family transcriptional regulator [Rubrivivax sp.]